MAHVGFGRIRVEKRCDFQPYFSSLGTVIPDGASALSETFDYIIVGAGSAGAALAARLAERTSHSILLLEAGGSDLHPYVQIPIGYGKVYYDSRVNWKYLTEPVAGLAGKPSYWPRGRVMGGSSSINAMVYVRGHPADYDRWAEDAPGWGWSDVEPLFRRMESWTASDDPMRGREGPLPVASVADQAHPICGAYFDACAAEGIAHNADYNAASMEGAANFQITTHRGRRASTARCYLRPALRTHRHLKLMKHAQVTRVLFEATRASGVRYRRGGREETASARAEIILCGGAINSPQLLQLSGIGPGGVLAANDIPVRAERAGVGRNLQDHLGYDHLYRCTVPTLNQELGPWYGKLWAGLKYLTTGRGPLALSLNQAGGFVTLEDSGEGPDIQLYFSPVSYTRAPAGTRPLMSPDPFPGFLLGYNPCRPTSRGHLAIRSPDPLANPEIHPNYLDTEHDRALMLAGARLIRRIAAAAPLDAIIDTRIAPDDSVADEAALLAHIRENAWTVFHPCGTCRMGDDPEAVVDTQLRVRGVEGLRVADASIFPTIPSGNTNAPAIMVGERAADLLYTD